MNRQKTVLSGAIALYFIIGLEILIMISPFAGFFYAVFNPFLLAIAKYPATRWLSSFFLPHMVIPPGALLQTIRVAGSVLFVGGLLVFIVCALQIYIAKFTKKGAVLKGLYTYIRHPQYLGLAICGIGLSILWPRFLVAVLWLAMILIYYYLARDEERRMLKAHANEYGSYMERTGMLLPKGIERFILPSSSKGRGILFAVIAVVVIGGAFTLRAYTTSQLPIWTDSNVVALSILPEDTAKMDHRMNDILQTEEIAQRLDNGEQYLVYFLPQHYIMQGLVADTGGEWKLYKRHHTLGMITDWIFHPFRHLREGHHSMHGGGGHHDVSGGIIRRLVFLKTGTTKSPSDVFSINTTRVPVFMADVEIHEAKVLSVTDLPEETGWGTVPVPLF
jgi:protein-S-isoprenylcysteine O-methyltransferase Ste14